MHAGAYFLIHIVYKKNTYRKPIDSKKKQTNI